MKIRTTKYFFSVLMIIFALTSCDKEELNNFESNKAENGYTIENGYIKFQSIGEYKTLYEKLSNLNNEALTDWNNNLSFKTLEVKYEEDKIEKYFSNGVPEGEMSYQLNTKRLNSHLASMFNEKGVLVINDTILKIKDEFLFTITNGDFSLLEKIDNDTNYESKYVIKQMHTIKLAATMNTSSDGMQKAISNRTPVFYTSSKTREAVTFEAYLSGGYIKFEMEGRYQKKSWLGWILSESSPLVYGRINGSGTCGGATINTNNPTEDDCITLIMQFYVGAYDPLPFDLTVTYNYKKTDLTAYIDEWLGTLNSTEGTFVRNYEYRQF